MTTFELIQVWVGSLSALALVLTLGVMAYQLRNDRRLQEFQLFRNLSKEYTTLLSTPTDEHCLRMLWKPLDAETLARFDAAWKHNPDSRWPLWETLDGPQRECYRLTRAGLELFEQAYNGHAQGWVSDEQTWRKWDSWMRDWVANNSFVGYVLRENREWFTDDFIAHMADLRAVQDERSADASAVGA